MPRLAGIISSSDNICLSICISALSWLQYLIHPVKPGLLILTSLNRFPDWLGEDFSNVVIFSEASSPFILYCMSHLLATIALWLFVAICVIPSDNVMKGHLEMNDASCHSLDLSFSISLCHPLIHLLSFLNLGALWKGSRSNQRVGYLDWGHLCSLYVGSGLTRCFLRQSVIQRCPSGSAQTLLTTHTLSRAQCQAMDYLTEWTDWRLPLFPGNPTACRLLALFWFERGQNTRFFWPTLPVSSGYRPQLRASTLHIRKNSKRARAKATASCTSGWQCLCLGWTRVKFYHSFPALLSFASSWCCC